MHALCSTVFLELVLVYFSVPLLFLQIPQILHKYTCGFAPALLQPRMTSFYFLLYQTDHPYPKCSPPWWNSAKWLLFLQTIDLIVSWTYRAMYVDYFVHSVPLTIHKLLWGMGQSDSHLFASAQHKDYVYYRIQSHLFHSFFPNSNGNHFNLKTCNSMYLQKVHSSFHGYYVCPQNHLLCEFCKAVFLAFFFLFSWK